MKNYVHDKPVIKDADIPVILIIRDSNEPICLVPEVNDINVYALSDIDKNVDGKIIFLPISRHIYGPKTKIVQTIDFFLDFKALSCADAEYRKKMYTFIYSVITGEEIVFKGA